MSTTLLWSRPTGAHRRTSASWTRLTEALATATQTSVDLTRELAEEREQRALADALMAQLVAQRLAAEARAEAAEEALTTERERLVRSGQVIDELRRQRDRPHGQAETTEIPMPLVMPLWESARRNEPDTEPGRASAVRPSWARAS